MTVHGSWTLDRLVEAYTQHQRRTRGLRPQTLRDRARLVRILIRAALGTDPVEPARLAPADVVVFITSLQGPVLPWVDADCAIDAAVVLPVPALPGILWRRA